MRDKKLTTPAHVTGHAGNVHDEKLTARLTLTVGVRGRNHNREQQHRKDQHQFAPHRRTATTATAAVVDDASRIARHVPETRTRLAG